MTSFSSAPRPLTALTWTTRFVERLPGDPVAENFLRQVSGAAYSEVRPTPMPDPRLAAWAEGLARELGIARPKSGDASEALLTGSAIPAGLRPYAARYGGHQFGNWAGQLGDGRAITLGEVETLAGRQEFQLKGAGLTPYSRRADGRAVLRSSLREFLASEAMHALGVPTTRALSLATTGEDVIRDLLYDGNPAAEPGAIVCRVAPSFLRFGNFEILATQGEHELLRRLADFLIEEHYAELAGAPDRYARVLDEISRRTAVMVAHWMRVGFVHGVMNTDNFSALSLTIDYGPYGWLDGYDPDWTPNTTDAEGRRYRYSNQPSIALWNLARLAEAFFPLVGDEDRLYRSLNMFRDTYTREHSRMIGAKLGLGSLDIESDRTLANRCFELLSSAETDFTRFFRALGAWKASTRDLSAVLDASIYASTDLTDTLRDEWSIWAREYSARLSEVAPDDDERRLGMNRVNPRFVPRNYLAQNAIDAAERGDFTVLERLMRVLERPYDDQPEHSDLAERRPDWARNRPGCSALSCSS